MTHISENIRNQILDNVKRHKEMEEQLESVPEEDRFKVYYSQVYDPDTVEQMFKQLDYLKERGMDDAYKQMLIRLDKKGLLFFRSQEDHDKYMKRAYEEG